MIIYIIMKKSIIIDTELIDAIVNSVILNAKEKMTFLKYIGYLTLSERKELMSIV